MIINRRVAFLNGMEVQIHDVIELVSEIDFNGSGGEGEIRAFIASNNRRT